MDKELSKRHVKKLEKRELIISTAERLFLQKGFENTSIVELSKEAGLAIRTIYKYFNSKEDIFFAVVLNGARLIYSGCEEAFRNGSNALEKIRLSNRAYCQFYLDNPEMFRLTNYQPDNKLNCEASPSFREMKILKDKLVKLYMDIVDEGKSDGSINVNLNTKMAVNFGFFSSIGLLRMVSTMGNGLFSKGSGLDEEEFLHFSMDLLVNALK